MKAFVWTMGVGDLRLASEEKGLCMNRSREGGSGKKKKFGLLGLQLMHSQPPTEGWGFGEWFGFPNQMNCSWGWISCCY